MADQDGEFQTEEEVLDLHRVFAVLRRRKTSILIGIAIALVPVFVLTARLRNEYMATAKVAIQGTPKVMEFGQDYMPSQPLRRTSDPVVELARSDAVLGRVAERFPRTPTVEPTVDPDPSLFSNLGQRLGLESSTQPLTPAQERQGLIGRIRRGLSLRLVGGGTVLEISSRSGAPELAASMANAVAEEFVEYKRAERETALRSATAWLGQRVLEVRGQIERAERAIADLVASEGLAPDETGQWGGSSQGDFIRDLRAARIELLTAKQRIAALEPRALEQMSRGTGEDRAALEQQYAEQRAALTRARLSYTPTHPEVTRLEATVSNLERRLESDFWPKTARDSGEEALSEYRALRAEESRLEARVAVLERALRELDSVHQPSSGARVAYDRMERELAINREMLGVLLQRRNETMLAAGTEVPDARLLDPAVTPVGPIGPSRRKYLVVGIAMALSFGAGLGILRELLDRQVRDPNQVAELLGLQILGTIPSVRDGSVPELQGAEGSSSEVAESYRLLRTTLLFSQRVERRRRGDRSADSSEFGTLVVTSGIAGEGKTTVSANLAHSFANAGRKVLLVDADLRRPRMDRVLRAERSPGLAELLRDSLPVEDVARSLPNLAFDVMLSGDIPPNPSELLDPSRLGFVLEQMKACYDLVLIDSPVLLSVPDALLLAARADATLLVHKPNSLDRSGLEQIRTDLERAGAHVLGIVLSQVKKRDRDLYPTYLESPYTRAGSA
jgi:capsular exopolysaccharide synthesis family protein